MTVDVSRRLQSLYVTVGDCVRLAVDVWLPARRGRAGLVGGAGGTVGTVMRVTRYHRADGPGEPEPEADTNAAAGELFNRAGFALVVADARGTGASFGTRAGELSEREIRDYGELVDWVAAQPWSNGRVGIYGTSYEGQAAELTAGLGNAHLVAAAALFSPYDPYRELFYPGGCGTAAGTRGGCTKASSWTASTAPPAGSRRSPGSQPRPSRCRRRRSRWTGRTVRPCSTRPSASTSRTPTCTR